TQRSAPPSSACRAMSSTPSPSTSATRAAAVAEAKPPEAVTSRHPPVAASWNTEMTPVPPDCTAWTKHRPDRSQGRTPPAGAGNDTPYGTLDTPATVPSTRVASRTAPWGAVASDAASPGWTSVATPITWQPAQAERSTATVVDSADETALEGG